MRLARPGPCSDRYQQVPALDAGGGARLAHSVACCVCSVLERENDEIDRQTLDGRRKFLCRADDPNATYAPVARAGVVVQESDDVIGPGRGATQQAKRKQSVLIRTRDEDATRIGTGP